MAGTSDPPERPRRPRSELAAVFLKLGLIGFGGPAAHIALMRREVVERRRWVTERRFLDLFAASNLIPGPSSTEMALLLGYERGGWPGLLVAGMTFIIPAVVIVLALAWTYVRFGSLPATDYVLYGVTPVVIAIVADALWRMARDAFRRLPLVLVAAAAITGYLMGASVVVLLVGGGIVWMLVENRERLSAWRSPVWSISPTGSLVATVAPHETAAFGLGTLFLTFLKIGATLYGSGYVLLAYLRDDFVEHLHWLTNRQVIDAIAAGQVSPGPVFTTATFVGYLTGGLGGALVATLAIFVPSFVFAAVVYRLLDRLTTSTWARGFLEGATASAWGLMAAVAGQLARTVVVDWVTAGLALAALAVLIRFSPNSIWLIVGGAAVGLVTKLVA